jgi:uncharacterized protein YndB with AHSA1/START domain
VDAKNSSDYLDREFTITRQFDAPREIVFNAWTDPKHLAQWWGPGGFTNPVCNVDVRPGGVIYIVMRAPNGVDYPMGGEFREIDPPNRLVFTSGALDEKGNLLFELLHTATFVDRSGKTDFTIKSRVIKTTPGAGKYIGGFEAGMTQSLVRLGELVSKTTDREIVISRTYDAPRELVWQAMTDPKHLVAWWGPRGFSTTIEEMDVRPGGAWNHIMHGPDGTNYPNRSTFKEIVKPERIVYLHGGGREGGPSIDSIVTWTFEIAEGTRTKVTIHMVFPTPADRDYIVREFGAIEGGKQTLARLGEHLTTMVA